jgi:DNA-binding transcriptional MerR regulator
MSKQDQALAIKDFAREKRMTVASELRCLGLSLEEIQEALAKKGYLNPKTGKPYSHVAVYNDLELVKKRWVDYQLLKHEEHVAKQLEELAFIKKAALGKEDLGNYIKALQHEAKLLGLESQHHSTVDINVTADIKQKLYEKITNYIDADVISNENEMNSLN